MASSANKQKTLLGFFKKNSSVKADVTVQANASEPASRINTQESSLPLIPKPAEGSIPSDATMFSDEHISSHPSTPHATDIDMEDESDGTPPPSKVRRVKSETRIGLMPAIR
jgi:hypothetical protein